MFQKEYLKLVGEEPTPVMLTEMEKLVRELPRDPEIVALFKRISDESMITIAIPSPAIAAPVWHFKEPGTQLFPLVNNVPVFFSQ